MNEYSAIPTGIEQWLICMIGYDVALHDILRKDIADNILAEASEAMKTMKSNNSDAQDIRTNAVDLSFIGGGNGGGGGDTSNPLNM